MTRAVRLVAHLVLSTAATLAVAAYTRAQGTGEPWKVRGRVTATACAGTRCATRLGRVKPLLRDQIGDVDLLGILCDCPGTSCVLEGGVECTCCQFDPTGACTGERAIVDPTTFGAYETSPHGARFNLTDRQALQDVLRVCFSNPTLAVTGFGALVRRDPGSPAFEERVHASFSFRVHHQPVAVTFAGRFHGTQVLTSVTRARQLPRRLEVDDLVRSVLAPP